MANANAEADIEQSLLSFETLDRSSPDLWPEKIPGVSEFVAAHSVSTTKKVTWHEVQFCDLHGNSVPISDELSSPKWLQDLDDEDVEMLKEFGSLTPAGLIDKVKQLQNLAYQLGLEEAREMTRGKFLNILETKKK